MLAAGFVQAEAVLGEPFQLGNPAAGTTYTGFFSAADEKINLELAGYVDQIDTICVAGLAQFTSPVPQVKTQLVRNGFIYTIRTLRVDFSAYVLGLQMITPAS